MLAISTIELFWYLMEYSKVWLESPHHLFSIILYTFSLSTIILELFSPKSLFMHWWIHHYITHTLFLYLYLCHRCPNNLFSCPAHFKLLYIFIHIWKYLALYESNNIPQFQWVKFHLNSGFRWFVFCFYVHVITFLEAQFYNLFNDLSKSHSLNWILDIPKTP